MSDPGTGAGSEPLSPYSIVTGRRATSCAHGTIQVSDLPYHYSFTRDTIPTKTNRPNRYLVTRRHAKTDFQASKFNPLLETKIIIPGWLDNMSK